MNRLALDIKPPVNLDGLYDASARMFRSFGTGKLSIPGPCGAEAPSGILKAMKRETLARLNDYRTRLTTLRDCL